jgi:glycosyltransferase involved in cell wall biosynthesis
MKKLISILSPTYNEEDNVDELYKQINAVTLKLKKYEFEHIFIDNSSEDNTVIKIKNIIKKDKRVKLIVNSRNFGHFNSPFHGLMQTSGEATIQIASDLQTSPKLIPKLLSEWEKGYKTVLLVKKGSDETKILFKMRELYYKFLKKISSVSPVVNATGEGLYDKLVLKTLKEINDPYPFFRGLIAEIGFSISCIEYQQEKRKGGSSGNSFYTLYDAAMLGITNHSSIPLRLMSIFGFLLSVVSFSLAVIFLLLKLIYWDTFELGLAPLLIGMFFFGAIQMFFLGLLGEYINAIHTRVRKMPLVTESERINF